MPPSLYLCLVSRRTRARISAGDPRAVGGRPGRSDRGISGARPGCGAPPYGLAVHLMVLSRRSLAQWRHAGHNRRARGARRRGDPRRLRGFRGQRRQLRSRLLVVAPTSFLVIGLLGFLRQPENRVAWWLVGVGVAFGCEMALGDVFLPMAENHWGVTSSITAAIALLDHWFAVAGPVAGVPSWDASSAGRALTARCWLRTAGCWRTSPPRPRSACTTSTWPRKGSGGRVEPVAEDRQDALSRVVSIRQ